MRDSRDKILDAFLDEVLNDARPEQSSAEILQHVMASLGELKTTGTIADPDDPESAESFNAAIQAAVHQAPESGAELETAILVEPENTWSFQWISILSLTAVIVAAAAIGIFLLNRGNENPNLVKDQDAEKTERTDNIQQPKPPAANRNFADNDNKGQQPRLDVPENRDEDLAPQPPGMAVRDDIPNDPDKLVVPPEFQRVNTINLEAQSPEQMAWTINEHLEEAWDVHDLKPARVLELRSWVNRLASRLIGRTLTAEEMPQVEGLLVQGKSPELIRQDLIDFFMDSTAYQAEFSEHWGQVLAWRMLGISPSMKTGDPDMLRTRQVLVEALAQDESLDEIAYEMISAVGSTLPSRDDFNAATSYMVGLRKRFGTPELSSAHVADVFLGRDAQCTQCHNHFGNAALADQSQRDFFEFHSFFAQLRIQAASEEKQQFIVNNRNYLPLGRDGKVEAAIKYTDLAGTEHQVFPRLEDFEPETNGFVAKVDRRTLLASQIVASDNFRETMVDHVWAAMMNLPLSGIDGTIAGPMAELRTEIANQFAANNFDLDWLVTTIASCDAFLVGVGTEEQLAANNPFLGRPPQFNIFYSRLENRRSAIQSLAIVAKAYSSGNIDEALNAGLLARVDDALEAAEPKFIHPFIPSKDSEWATSPLISRQLDLIADSTSLTDRQKVEHLVQAALGRPARDQEIEQALVILKSSTNQRTALQDVWWSLLNSVDYKIPLDVR